MSIVYDNKEVLRLIRILELDSADNPVITLKTPERREYEKSKKIIFRPDERVVQFPVEGKVKASDIDIVSPPFVEPEQLTTKGFQETLNKYIRLGASIDYETKASKPEEKDHSAGGSG